jgi:hypothetical protein
MIQSNKILAMTLLTAGAIFLGVREAQAISITVGSNLPSGLYIGGSPVNGSFDINPALPSNLYQQPFDVVSASVLLQFHDNADGYSTSTAYQYGYWNGNNHYDVYNTYYEYPYEAATVTAGQDSGTTQSNYFSNYDNTTTNFYGSSEYSYYCGWGTCYSYDYYYATTNYFSQGYTGSFSLAQSLSLASLSDLASGGVLNFSIAPTGDFYFDSATLTADVNLNPSPVNSDPLNSDPVPEPMSLTLLGTGLIGIANRIWRSRRLAA